MFAKALKGQNIEDLLSNLSAAPVAAAGPVATGAPAGAAPAKEARMHFLFLINLFTAKKEEKKEEEAADVDMGGLFGDEY